MNNIKLSQWCLVGPKKFLLWFLLSDLGFDVYLSKFIVFISWTLWCHFHLLLSRCVYLDTLSWFPLSHWTKKKKQKKKRKIKHLVFAGWGCGRHSLTQQQSHVLIGSRSSWQRDTLENFLTFSSTLLGRTISFPPIPIQAALKHGHWVWKGDCSEIHIKWRLGATSVPDQHLHMCNSEQRWKLNKTAALLVHHRLRNYVSTSECWLNILLQSLNKPLNPLKWPGCHSTRCLIQGRGVIEWSALTPPCLRSPLLPELTRSANFRLFKLVYYTLHVVTF